MPGPSIDEHHLVPRSLRGRETVTMHRICHRKIHSVLSEKELRDGFATPAALRRHPELRKFIAWVARKPPEFIDRHRPPRDRGRR